MSRFHVRDVITFERKEDGVVIMKDASNKIDYKFTKEEWCSIVTAVAAKAHDAVIYQKVCKIHLGK